MLECICEVCGKKFLRKKSQIKLAIKHYCSLVCAEKGRRKGKTTSCFVCKKEVYKSLKELNRSQSKKYFCSRQCCNKWLGPQQQSSKHPNWVSGESSYKLIMQRENLLEVCFLCEKNDKRILTVHHIDKNRKNNTITNLVCLCQNCHFLIHHYEDIQKDFSVKHKKYATRKM